MPLFVPAYHTLTCPVVSSAALLFRTAHADIMLDLGATAGWGAGGRVPEQSRREHIQGPIRVSSRDMTSANSPRPSAALAQTAATLCLDNKANDVVILDLDGVTEMTDFFVIASGTSDTHVRSIAEHVMEGMKKAGRGRASCRRPGAGSLGALDFVDFVVHIFHPTLRAFYQLERLWGDAAVVAVASQGALR